MFWICWRDADALEFWHGDASWGDGEENVLINRDGAESAAGVEGEGIEVEETGDEAQRQVELVCEVAGPCDEGFRDAASGESGVCGDDSRGDMGFSRMDEGDSGELLV